MSYSVFINKKQVKIMVVFETDSANESLFTNVVSSFTDANIARLKPLIGNELTQLILPISALVIPSVTQIVLKIIKDKRVIIKNDGIEVSAEDLEVAMKAYKELRKENSANDN